MALTATTERSTSDSSSVFEHSAAYPIKAADCQQPHQKNGSLHLFSPSQGSAMWCRPPWRRSKPWNTKASEVPPCTSSRRFPAIFTRWCWGILQKPDPCHQATQRKGVAAGERKARKAGLAEEACWCDVRLAGKDHVSLEALFQWKVKTILNSSNITILHSSMLHTRIHTIEDVIWTRVRSVI